MDIVHVPGSDFPEQLPEDIRRAWIRRRVSASTSAVDALIGLALGDLPADLQPWPTPVSISTMREVAHA